MRKLLTKQLKESRGWDHFTVSLELIYTISSVMPQLPISPSSWLKEVCAYLPSVVITFLWTWGWGQTYLDPKAAYKQWVDGSDPGQGGEEEIPTWYASRTEGEHVMLIMLAQGSLYLVWGTVRVKTKVEGYCFLCPQVIETEMREVETDIQEDGKHSLQPWGFQCFYKSTWNQHAGLRKYFPGGNL